MRRRKRERERERDREREEKPYRDRQADRQVVRQKDRRVCVCKAPYQVPSERENKREKERERYRVSQTERETDRQKEVEMPDLGLPSLPSECLPSLSTESEVAAHVRAGRGRGRRAPALWQGRQGPRAARAHILYTQYSIRGHHRTRMDIASVLPNSLPHPHRPARPGPDPASPCVRPLVCRHAPSAARASVGRSLSPNHPPPLRRLRPLAPGPSPLAAIGCQSPPP